MIVGYEDRIQWDTYNSCQYVNNVCYVNLSENNSNIENNVENLEINNDDVDEIEDVYMENDDEIRMRGYRKSKH